MRLFIAICLTDAMKDALVRTQDVFRAAGVKGNYSSRENLHITLAFIGEYPDPEPILDALDTVSFSPVPLSLDRMGAFVDLWWAGLSGSPALQALARRIRRALAEAEIPFDRKKFSPHITLIRRESACSIPAVAVPSVSMMADTVSLMRSDRGKNGMIYTEIGILKADGT